MKRISKITAGVIGIVVGSAVIFGQPNYYNIDLTESIALTQSTDLATEDASTTQPTADVANVSLEDTKISNTTYINYGEGGVLVNIIKDSASSEETTEDIAENDVDNVEENQQVATPEVTEDVETETEEQSGQESSMNNTYLYSSVELLDACLTEEEKAEVIAGGTKELRVTFHVATEDELKQRKLEEIGTAMDDYMLATTGLSFCNYLQITVEKKDSETGKWKKLKNFDTQIEVSVDILPEIQNEAGSFKMLAPNGNVYDLLDDEDEYGETITFSMRGTGVYALCHQAEIAESKTTPEPTSKPSFVGKLMTSDLCLWHWIMCAFFIVGLTWVAAINAKKKRVVFMGVMDVIFLVCAVIGRCLYCWCFLAAFVIILFLVHVWKTKRISKRR